MLILLGALLLPKIGSDVMEHLAPFQKSHNSDFGTSALAAVLSHLRLLSEIYRQFIRRPRRAPLLPLLQYNRAGATAVSVLYGRNCKPINAFLPTLSQGDKKALQRTRPPFPLRPKGGRGERAEPFPQSIGYYSERGAVKGTRKFFFGI